MAPSRRDELKRGDEDTPPYLVFALHRQIFPKSWRISTIESIAPCALKRSKSMPHLLRR